MRVHYCSVVGTFEAHAFGDLPEKKYANKLLDNLDLHIPRPSSQFQPIRHYQSRKVAHQNHLQESVSRGERYG